MGSKTSKMLAYRVVHQPCSLGCQSLEAPIHHQSHHPSRQASWRQGQGYAEACPNPAKNFHNK